MKQFIYLMIGCVVSAYTLSNTSISDVKPGDNTIMIPIEKYEGDEKLNQEIQNLLTESGFQLEAPLTEGTWLYTNKKKFADWPYKIQLRIKKEKGTLFLRGTCFRSEKAIQTKYGKISSDSTDGFVILLGIGTTLANNMSGGEIDFTKTDL
jgi:hypothetical protein